MVSTLFYWVEHGDAVINGHCDGKWLCTVECGHFAGEHVAAGNAFLLYAGYLNLIFIADFRGGPRVKFLAGSDHGDIRFADLLVGDSRVEFINRGGA